MNIAVIENGQNWIGTQAVWLSRLPVLPPSRPWSKPLFLLALSQPCVLHLPHSLSKPSFPLTLPGCWLSTLVALGGSTLVPSMLTVWILGLCLSVPRALLPCPRSHWELLCSPALCSAKSMPSCPRTRTGLVTFREGGKDHLMLGSYTWEDLIHPSESEGVKLNSPPD